MPYDLIQGQDPQKVAKMVDFKVYLLCRYACNQKTNGELWHSVQCVHFVHTDFRCLFSFCVTWSLNVGCFKKFFSSNSIWPQLSYGLVRSN